MSGQEKPAVQPEAKVVTVTDGVPTIHQATVSQVPAEAKVQPTDNYVAWLTFQHHSDNRVSIHVCDSDTKGAFKVYRHAPAPDVTRLVEEVDTYIRKKEVEFCDDCGVDQGGNHEA
jgi:hypothetical protein